MLALVVLVSAVSIGWAIHQPEKAAPEEESGSSEVVLQSFSESDCAPYESYFTDFSDVTGAAIINVGQSQLIARVYGTLNSTNSQGQSQAPISLCGDCTVVVGGNPLGENGFLFDNDCIPCSFNNQTTQWDVPDLIPFFE
mgnify:FL=1